MGKETRVNLTDVADKLSAHVVFHRLKIYLGVQQSADMAHQLCSYQEGLIYNDVNKHRSGFDLLWTHEGTQFTAGAFA